ncbi:hypothetical protein CISIN_1g045414mg, partial [Citrus sinensis]
MSLISKLRHHLPNRLSRNPSVYPILALRSLSFNGVASRSFGQTVKKEEEEEEEVEIDQRRLPANYNPATFDYQSIQVLRLH